MPAGTHNFSEWSTLSYPGEKTITGTGASAIKFSIFKRDGRSGGSKIQDIYLYMPQSANIPSTTDWDGSARLGLAGHLMTEGIKAGGVPSMDEIAKGANTILEGVLGTMGYNAASWAAAKLGSGATGETLMGAAGQKVPNPYLTLLFRGVNLRSFEFAFRLFPRNQGEKSMIVDIIKSLRKNALPDGKAGDVFFEYPPYFEIEYLYEGQRNQNINKFKKCSLVAVNTDYTASGMWSVTRDGMPTDIALSLRFTEEELVLQEDIDQGY